MIIDVPNLKVKSPNRRAGHWKGHFFGYARPTRELVGLVVRSKVGRQVYAPPLEIVLQRISPRELDFDNLVAGMKPVRDGVTDGLGLKDDRESKGLTWVYGQMRGMPGENAVKIEIKRMNGSDHPTGLKTGDRQ